MNNYKVKVTKESKEEIRASQFQIAREIAIQATREKWIDDGILKTASSAIFGLIR